MNVGAIVSITAEKLFFYDEMEKFDISDEVYDFLEEYFLRTKDLARCKLSARLASMLKPKSDNIESFMKIFDAPFENV